MHVYVTGMLEISYVIKTGFLFIPLCQLVEPRLFSRPGNTVSSISCFMFLLQTSLVELTDSNSKFGTTINGKKLPSNTKVSLSLNDEIKFGQGPSTGKFRSVLFQSPYNISFSPFSCLLVDLRLYPSYLLPSFSFQF